MVTTNSNHKFEVYLNLARRMKLSGMDQLWVADITYIRLKAEFGLSGGRFSILLRQGRRLGAGPHDDEQPA